MKLIYIDTETTGLTPGRNDIIELAGIIEIDGVVKEEFDLYMQPFDYNTVEAKALEINQFTLDQLKTFPTGQQAYADFISILKKYVNPYDKTDKFVVVGQNVKFDLDHMRAWFTKCGDKFFGSFFDYHAYDLVSISMFLKLSGMINPEKMKLEHIAAYFGIRYGSHRAIEDIRVTREVFLKYYELIKKGAPAETKRCDICHSQFLHVDVFNVPVQGDMTAKISMCTQCQKVKAKEA
jgi:DNA polymerase-3 subunit epsilon